MARIPAIELDIHPTVGVRPGDKLIIAVTQLLDMASRDRLKQHLEAELPGVEVVPVQAAALAVYRS